MPVLRNLVSRFSFETDKKSVNEYHKTIGGMKGAAVKLGSALGLSLGAKSLFNLGLSAKQASADIKRLAGTNLDVFNDKINQMKLRLDEAQAGVSNLLKKRTIDTLGAGFIENFGAGSESIEQFVGMLEVATRQSALTGKSIEETFSGIQQFIISGEAAGLKGIGDITLRQQKVLEARAGAIDPQEFGTQAGRALRAEMLSNVLKQTSDEQIKQLKNMDKSLLQLRESQKFVEDKVERGSEITAEAVIKQTAESIKALTNAGANLGKSIADLEKSGDVNVDSIIGWLKSLGAEDRARVQAEVAEREKKKEADEREEEPAKKKTVAAEGIISRGEFKKISLDDILYFDGNENIKKASDLMDKALPQPSKKEDAVVIDKDDKKPVIKKIDDSENNKSSIIKMISNSMADNSKNKSEIIEKTIKEKRTEVIETERKAEALSEKGELNIKIDMPMTFHITEASDAKAISKEIKENITSTVREASVQLIPSEDRSQ